ncbi:MAG: aminopeptidase P family protein [Lachnospiraceae bacterium]|nr:aminopeptidase P family protein [Lachnospiraceae bacterium]
MYNDTIHKRLDDLRSKMNSEGIDYYLFVTADFHSSEYVSDYFKAREYFSGFNGSNGDLLVWKDGAALWTDGRYFLQAGSQLEGTGIDLMKMGMKGVPTVEEFLTENMLPGQVLGFDGRCIPLGRGKEFEKVCEAVDKKACADAENPVKTSIVLKDLAESVWINRPALPANTAWLLTKGNTGESRKERLNRVREEMANNKCDELVLSSLDDIAWLLLLRGTDIDFNPVALSYAIIHRDSLELYINESIITDDVKKSLEADGVSIKAYNEVYADTEKLSEKVTSVMIDPKRVSYTLYKCLTGKNAKAKLVLETCPITIMKACKTPEEINFERIAHVKDGVAVTKLLFKLHELKNDPAFISGEKKVTELEVADVLLGLRKEQEGFLDQSFAPIIATADHGAIIHYEPDEKTNAVIKKDAFLLMDTGGQYKEGTTDITRTVIMGEPTAEEKRLYTAVLCGNLRLAAATFPEGTTGQNLDILARAELWKAGLDYRHGTGHGVGFLLNVHEGPQNINLKGAAGKLTAAFREGMITSDEPGVYLDGKFGIRLENMMVCLNVDKLYDEGKNRAFTGEDAVYAKEYGPFYGFETLTMVPFDKASIDKSLMTGEDIRLLNAYHTVVYEHISPYLNDDEKAWLKDQTSAL